MTQKSSALHKVYVIHPELLEVGSEVLPLCRNGDVVVLALFFGQQLEPPVLRRLDDLRDAEGHRAHEVVAGRTVPVPHLDQQTPVFVVGAEITEK